MTLSIADMLEEASQVEELSAAIAEVLQGRGPIFQSAVVVSLLALYLARLPRQYREEELAKVVQLARDLAEIYTLTAADAAANDRPC